MEESKYTVRGYATDDISRGCDCETYCETLTEARKKAKYFISVQNMLDCESTVQLQYAEVIRNKDSVRIDDFCNASDS